MADGHQQQQHARASAARLPSNQSGCHLAKEGLSPSWARRPPGLPAEPAPAWACAVSDRQNSGARLRQSRKGMRVGREESEAGARSGHVATHPASRAARAASAGAHAAGRGRALPWKPIEDSAPRPGAARPRGDGESSGGGGDSPSRRILAGSRLRAARPHDAREVAAGGGAGEAQRRPTAALEAKALPAEREGAAALRGRQPRLDALQGAQFRARQGRRVRRVEAAAHLLHRGDRRRRRDRLPLPAGGAQLERRHHHGAGALQEPAGGADRPRQAQLQGRISARNSPGWPDSGERAKGARSRAQFGKSGGADGCEFTCQWTEGNSQLPLTVDWLVLFCGIMAGK